MKREIQHEGQAVVKRFRLLSCLSVLSVVALAAWWVCPSQAYVEAPMSLGAIVQQSTNIMLVRVEKVDREKSLIIYTKVRDIKGKHPTDVVKHNIVKQGLRPNEWKPQMDWAEPGKMAVFFHNGGASETCIGNWWYQAYAGGDWWNHSHGEPFMLRSYAGSPEKLAALVTEMLNGKEVIVPCMVDGNKEDLHSRKAKVQRFKASLKLQDYNPKRDFVGWGGEDFRRLQGMPGFTHYSALTRVDPEAQAISAVDFDGDGKPDLCLLGAGRMSLLQNGGEALSDVTPSGASGGRAAVWADYNGDGKPDLLLATPMGPKLFTNLGAGQFRDDSHLLPSEPGYSLTSAAWIDHDGDGRPDILLANGYGGLRLYRNAKRPEEMPVIVAPKLGPWRHCGPWDNSDGRANERTQPCEKEFDPNVVHKGKNGARARWRDGNFTDGVVNSLALFTPENNVRSAVYLYRDIEASGAMELPVSLGSDDGLTVWINGAKVLEENSSRACAPDQNQVTLPLKQGMNRFMMRITQGEGDWAFYFAANGTTSGPKGKWFEDISQHVGLGPDGIGAGIKGDTLTVCDVNGDGRPDFLYGAGNGMLVLNTARQDGSCAFTLAKDSGIAYDAGKVGPVFGDFDGDGKPDLFVPQKGHCKLFRNEGNGKFRDVTAKAGDLAADLGWATCAAWGDFDNDGRLDLLVGCLRGPNRLFRNKGDGTFEDATEAVGLHQRIFNTQAVCLVDLNNDGALDAVFNNEGQESCVLLGNYGLAGGPKRIPVTVQVAGKGGIVGSRVEVADKAGKTVAAYEISGGSGRGGQPAPQAHFALEPGTYRVQVRYSSGTRRVREITVATDPMRSLIDDQAAAE